MDEAECGKRSALKGARCVWEGARSLDFAYFTFHYSKTYKNKKFSFQKQPL